MPSKVWHNSIYLFPCFNGNTVNVWEWISNFNLHMIINGTTYSRGLGIRVGKYNTLQIPVWLTAVQMHGSDSTCKNIGVNLILHLLFQKVSILHRSVYKILYHLLFIIALLFLWEFYWFQRDYLYKLPVMQSVDVFFDVWQSKRWSKHPSGYVIREELTHRGRDKMAATSQTTL